ncbi:abortive infection family protein [Mesorhizobium sp. WSM2561]|uniref:abortive infection family protein n=1 Tax=Mesorhizobium sp. WSM2561 TaxID=1040985 RepID=UPI002477E010|nr:abortive infection family protein [Mesorhizobium sp. WSM2561]
MPVHSYRTRAPASPEKRRRRIDPRGSGAARAFARPSDLPAEVEADIRTDSGRPDLCGIGALRTHAGDAHGREKGFKPIDPRIAHFAINAGSSIALFLIETWERKEHRTLPQHPA